MAGGDISISAAVEGMADVIANFDKLDKSEQKALASMLGFNRGVGRGAKESKKLNTAIGQTAIKLGAAITGALSFAKIIAAVRFDFERIKDLQRGAVSVQEGFFAEVGALRVNNLNFNNATINKIEAAAIEKGKVLGEEGPTKFVKAVKATISATGVDVDTAIATVERAIPAARLSEGVELDQRAISEQIATGLVENTGLDKLLGGKAGDIGTAIVSAFGGGAFGEAEVADRVFARVILPSVKSGLSIAETSALFSQFTKASGDPTGKEAATGIKGLTKLFARGDVKLRSGKVFKSDPEKIFESVVKFQKLLNEGKLGPKAVAVDIEGLNQQARDFLLGSEVPLLLQKKASAEAAFRDAAKGSPTQRALEQEIKRSEARAQLERTKFEKGKKAAQLILQPKEAGLELAAQDVASIRERAGVRLSVTVADLIMDPLNKLTEGIDRFREAPDAREQALKNVAGQIISRTGEAIDFPDADERFKFETKAFDEFRSGGFEAMAAFLASGGGIDIEDGVSRREQFLLEALGINTQTGLKSAEQAQELQRQMIAAIADLGEKIDAGNDQRRDANDKRDEVVRNTKPDRPPGAGLDQTE